MVALFTVAFVLILFMQGVLMLWFHDMIDRRLKRLDGFLAALLEQQPTKKNEDEE